jgi:hypothetical protein
MAKKPEFKQIGATTYACTVCPNYKVEIVNRLNEGELQRHLAVRLAQHIKECHSDEDFSQAAARIVNNATRE